MLKRLFFLYIWISSSLSAGEYYRRDYTYIADSQAFYKVYKSKLTFSNALTLCKAEGSKLFVPLSKKELDDVLKLASAKMNYFWNGIYDVNVEGEYTALYDIPISKVYWKWTVGEPNNRAYANNSYDEDCVVVDRNGLSNDVPCNHNFYPICKRELENLHRNELCENFDLEYIYAYALDRCYKLHTTPMKWQDAYKFCKAEESFLAIINGVDEASELIRIFNNHTENSGSFIHLGFNDLINNGRYTTIKNQLVSETGYHEWADNEPDNMGGSKHCGAMTRNGKLSAVNCSTQALFICEKEVFGDDQQSFQLTKQTKPTKPTTPTTPTTLTMLTMLTTITTTNIPTKTISITPSTPTSTGQILPKLPDE